MSIMLDDEGSFVGPFDDRLTLNDMTQKSGRGKDRQWWNVTKNITTVIL